MTPEQKLNELYNFMQSLKNSALIPHEFDVAFRDRFSDLYPATLPTDLTTAPRSAITAPTGGVTQDAEARTAINAIITALEQLGLVTEN